MRSSTEGFSRSYHYTLPNSQLPANELGIHENISTFVAYGWPSDLSDEEILERLLALNLERAEIG